MRRRSGFALAILLMVSACAAGDATEEGRDGILAVSTISILEDFVFAVGGDRVESRTIVHIGGDPHVYEPVPSDARLVADADIVFTNGLGLERWIDKLIESAGVDRPVVTLTDGLTPLVEESGVYAGDPDPHMWMDPMLAARYVEAARDALTELDPEGAEEYAANARAYIAELEELDRWIADQMATIPEPNRKLVTTHDAFRYFGERYGLTIVGTIWAISTEREPSADEIRTLVDAIRSEGVPTLFIETTINPRVMQQVARDAGVGIGEPLYGDSVGEPGSGAEAYVGMMRANTRSIVAGLGGRVEE